MGQIFTTPTYDYTQTSQEGSPTSTTPTTHEKADLIVPGGVAAFRGRDPRSISQEVNRTPIQLDKSEEDQASVGSTSTDAKSQEGSQENWIHKKMKSLSLDPRSPSGIPRTPIMIQDSPNAKDNSADQDSETTPIMHKKPPLRGHHAMPASKLSFSPEVDAVDKENNPPSTIRPKLESPNILIENPSSPILAKDNNVVVVKRALGTQSQVSSDSRLPLIEANMVEVSPPTNYLRENTDDTTFAPQVNSTVVI
ncbi:hypothetical protein TCAL_03464 [Tigriopus californicus]|uniref:Uncharacterized protein n=1 Tax=Tigriopus californicus TaxID=6832 RepID=A0A553NQF9_TIGCA|nr:uncharacterized protein LOC131878740 [Tigriopus californicus]TRY67650.1 hypothetical protein TCAL_03464 [Tigriopus californicus]|eukprot:TCALIF_03464-PA protein Name:"Protein of unknown function" AED:0.00 eAED:0.00 QI:156/1/1/1/1/1/3/138/251